MTKKKTPPPPGKVDRRGGKRPGSGRKPKPKAPPPKPEPPKQDPNPEPPPAPPPPPTPEPPPTPPPPPPKPEPPPGNDQDDDDDDEPIIDFDAYKRAQKGDQAAKGSSTPLEEPIVQPAQPKVVVIDGKTLMAIVNFLAPPLFAWVCNFATGGYEKEDFDLEEEKMQFLYPAADSVAKRIFANMPDYVQLIFGYGIISFSEARKKKKWRENRLHKVETIHVDAL